MTGVEGRGRTGIARRAGSTAPALALALAIVAAPLAGPAARADGAPADPRAWLERMAVALRQLNYEGTLVQFTDGEASVMRVVHRVDGNTITERVTALDDVGREIIREGPDTKCILPDQRSVMVEEFATTPAGASSPLKRSFAGPLRISDTLYSLSAEPGGHLVGRSTTLVRVRPRDGFRYGYRLWLDDATGMPLKIQIADDRNAVQEQVLFSDIRLAGRIPAESVRPSLKLNAFTWRRSGEPSHRWRTR